MVSRKHSFAGLAIGWLVVGILTAGLSALPPTLYAEDETAADAAVETGIESDAASEAELLTDVRQLTFAGRRAGEGYFNADGTKLIFQSERDPANPFYQIYLMDLETGDIERVSNGVGKTTCAWISPAGDQALFASTHDDPEASAKQQTEIDFRASGQERRYAWDYDENFEIYAKDLNTGALQQLTTANGYDAEGSYSPDGTQIVFASNRDAYSRELTDREATQFEIDPAAMIDIYIMRADGSDVRRLTDTFGYDGGPFFSPDGQRVCWRRFAEDGVTAEIYTMRVDGTDVRRLTSLGAMSWAPFYHPSGDYLIFTTNRHGFGNFELYLVRADGEGEPVRVTYTDGFDGLPVFAPAGDQLSWTSNRTSSGRSQIYFGDWNDAEARQRLGLAEPPGDDLDRQAALAAADATVPEFSAADAGRHVDFLTRRELGGRLTGTEGERRATAYVAAYLETIGFEPAAEDGTFFQAFEFPAGSSLGRNNSLQVGERELVIDQDFRPLAFSMDGQIKSTGVVFAGYGMSVPAADGVDEYDSYVHLDVADKWVLVLRDLPQEISSDQRQQMARYSTPRRKASVARDHGARGIIFVSGPTSQVSRQLIRFDNAASQAGVSIGAVSISNDVAAEMFATAGKDLAELQRSLDDGSSQLGFALEGLNVSATFEIERKTGVGRNVIARLRGPAAPVTGAQVVVVGAHIDHLGVGGGSNSLATDNERDLIHFGADDNASGVAALLEIAQYIAGQKSAGKLPAQRDLLIAAWSGEELGLFGSQAFVESYFELYPDAPRAGTASIPHPHGEIATAHGQGGPGAQQPLTAAIAAYLNLDMVGRLRERLIVQGIGSSPLFASDVERRNNVSVRLDLRLDKTAVGLPTDASAFVAREVPILSAFTGAHEDYHTPRDTPEKLNYEGIAKTANLFALLTRGLLVADQSPEFKLEEGEQERDRPQVALRAYLGTIPDYAAGELKGLRLSGVSQKGPAAQAGVQAGDVIVELAGRKVEDIYDYTYAIEALKIGEPVELVVERNGDTKRIKITPGSRD